jgi:hypothetical protein
MFLLGIILFVIGAIAGWPIIWSIGLVLAVIGAVLWSLGMAGRGVGGRRHYW